MNNQERARAHVANAMVNLCGDTSLFDVRKFADWQTRRDAAIDSLETALTLLRTKESDNA